MTDPYQSKGYEPIRVEYDCDDVVIEGQIPKDLNGTFYRIGPNPQFPPRGAYNPLNGDGMVHAFCIHDGRVSYRNRWVRTQQWHLEHTAGRALFGTSGAPADADPSVAGKRTDGVANTNLVWHAGRLLTLEEGHAPIEIAADSLETLGGFSFDGALPRNMTAHPKIDPASGEMLFFANFPSGRFTGDVAFYTADSSGALIRAETIRGPFAALMHDFAVTCDFVIFVYCPVTVSIERARAGGPPIAWEPQLGTHVGIMPRRGGANDVQWFVGPPGMVWHTLNAFNEGERITVDVCRQDVPMFPGADGSPPDHRRAKQLLTRWTFDWRKSGAFDSAQLYDGACEYPRVDERRTGLPYRYGYVACLGGPGTDDIFQRGIGRFDHTTGTMDLYSAGPHRAVAEPVFVAKPGGVGECEGYVLTNVFDEVTNTSFFALFDASDIAAGPIARAHLKHRVPVGFHGCWRPRGP